MRPTRVWLHMLWHLMVNVTLDDYIEPQSTDVIDVIAAMEKSETGNGRSELWRHQEDAKSTLGATPKSVN